MIQGYEIELLAGSALGVGPAWDSLSPSPSAPPHRLHTLALTLSLKKKKKDEEEEEEKE